MLPPVTRAGPDGPAVEPYQFRCKAAGMIVVAARLRRGDGGATSIEYALIAGLVFLAIVTGIQTYATSMNSVYGAIEAAITKSK